MFILKGIFMQKCNLNVKETSEYLNVSLHTIRKWVSQKRIPFVKLGDRIIFKLSDLEDHLENNLVKPQAHCENR
jgi:excisionase family DNA binding protein